MKVLKTPPALLREVPACLHGLHDVEPTLFDGLLLLLLTWDEKEPRTHDRENIIQHPPLQLL